jgi:hypothetical protein
MIENSQSLLSVAEEFTFRYGIGVIPINGSKRPVVGRVVDKRRRIATREELEDYFGPNGTKKAQWLAAVLDSPKPLIALDLDGTGFAVFEKKVLPKCSNGLRRAIDRTTRTKTPRNGLHILLRIQSEDFPNSINTKLFWNELGNGNHNQINLMGKGHYLVERGPRYEPINELDCLVTLTKEQVKELLYVLGYFESEMKASRNICIKLVKYYQPTNRQNIALRVSGYLYKQGIPEHLSRDLIEHLIKLAGGDEESEKRYQAVRDTYSRNASEVSGYAKLLEAVNGDHFVIVIIQKEFSKLGYHFNGNYDHRIGSESNDSELEESGETSNSATELLTIVEPEIAELFKNQLNNPFAAIRINGHIETIPIPASNSGKFKMWIFKTYYEKAHKVLSNGETIAAVYNTLRAKALFGNFTNTLSLRVSNGHDDSNKTIYYDLTNKDWQVVKITESGWSVENSNDVPIMFRRYQNQRAQVIPSKNYPPDIFDQLLNLINIENDEGTRLLLKCYIITLFIPEIAKAALMLHGPEAAGKTACQELIKSVVDPSIIPTLTFPRDIDGLIQQLSHNYVAYYDNVSVLPEWLSDALCRAVTGTGFSKRELYSDDDDVIYQFLRCIGFNGINLAATKSDLLDRGIIVGLKRIDDKKKKIRELKGEILPEFEKILPQLLGYIFDILIKVLKVMNNGGIEIKSKSRMADFEKYAEVISQCMGYEPMRFINVYHENKKLRTDNVLETSPVARAVIDFMETTERWQGTTPELLAELESIAPKLKINTQRERLWPKAANVLARRLNEIKSNLEEVGILVNDTKDPVKRTVILEICKISLESFEPFESKQLRSTGQELSKDIPKDTLGDDYIISLENSPENHIQNREVKDMRDMKDFVQSSYGNPNMAEISTCRRSKAYICQWCRIIHNRIASYQTSDFLEKHTVNKHAGWTAYPGPADIQKFEREQMEKQQLKRNMETKSD